MLLETTTNTGFTLKVLGFFYTIQERLLGLNLVYKHIQTLLLKSADLSKSVLNTNIKGHSLVAYPSRNPFRNLVSSLGTPFLTTASTEFTLESIQSNTVAPVKDTATLAGFKDACDFKQTSFYTQKKKQGINEKNSQEYRIIESRKVCVNLIYS
jgi:hypothetical protein